LIATSKFRKIGPMNGLSALLIAPHSRAPLPLTT
jgi:hypothetical protein